MAASNSKQLTKYCSTTLFILLKDNVLHKHTINSTITVSPFQKASVVQERNGEMGKDKGHSPFLATLANTECLYRCGHKVKRDSNWKTFHPYFGHGNEFSFNTRRYSLPVCLTVITECQKNSQEKVSTIDSGQNGRCILVHPPSFFTTVQYLSFAFDSVLKLF